MSTNDKIAALVQDWAARKPMQGDVKPDVAMSTLASFDGVLLCAHALRPGPWPFAYTQHIPQLSPTCAYAMPCQT